VEQRRLFLVRSLSSPWLPAALSVGGCGGFELQIGNQQRIDDVKRFVGLGHENSSAAWKKVEKFAV
jgi:hypothetical protein